MANTKPHILIVEARFYDVLADHLLEGAKSALAQSDASYDIVTVPGALEIPAAISYGVQQVKYDGFVALGTVIRGETYHFEIVANESARAIMDLSVNKLIAVGNGILTVENMQQAMARADKEQKNKGGEAAIAALTMIDLRAKLTSYE